MPFWVKKTAAQRKRIFFVTDVHGSEPTFRKFINAGKVYGVDSLILGGDITGKMLIPIIALGKNTYRATLQSRTVTLGNLDELKEFETRLAKLGFYSSVMSEAEYLAMKEHPDQINRLFLEKAGERLEAWIRLAEERLDGSNLRCYMTGGNDDPVEIVEIIQRCAKDRVVACEEKFETLDDEGHTMISLGYSNQTPWHTPREITEEELAKRIEGVFKGIDDFSKLIFNMHVPPVDSTLDTCPMLDTSTDPPTVITSGGEPVMFGAGSPSVRAAIERYQPLLSLHGHIHESRNVTTLGRTTAVNPGSEYGEGILRGIIVTLVGDKVESTQMTSG
jgi:Icc-related predicted phosphoesterase